MHRRPPLPLLGLLVIVVTLAGCKKARSKQGAMLPYTKKSEYKPVIGRYGGQFVRDTLSEPKSFNPITAGETSTTDFTYRIFQGLTDEDPWTGEMNPLL